MLPFVLMNVKYQLGLFLLGSWLSVVQAQTQVPALSPADMARLSDQSAAARGQQYEVLLQQAATRLGLGVAYPTPHADDGEVAVRHLQDAARLRVPNADWYNLLALAHQRRGDAAQRSRVLAEGHEAYPFAEVLAAAWALDQLQSQEFSPAALRKLSLPPQVELVLLAQDAFANKRWINGLFLAERAYFLDTDSRLLPGLRGGVVEAYNRHASANEAIATSTEPLDSAYSHCLQWAFARLATEPLDTSSGFVRAHGQADPAEQWPRARQIALRRFVSEGHLGRYPSDLLTDSYVLDQAGHYLAASQLFLEAFGISNPSATRKEDSGPRLAAQRYMQTQWASDVEALLAR